MSLIAVVIILVIVGVFLYLVETIVPMDPTIRVVIRVLVLLVVLLWILSLFTGGFGYLGNIRIGR